MIRKTFINISLTLIALCWSMALQAQTATVDDITYSLNTTDMTASVTGGSVSGDVVIPSEITVDGATYNVTSISNSAFYQNTTITSINMPSVISIGSLAFKNCTSLTLVSMPQVTSIKGRAFYGCTNLTSANMPLVTSIGLSAFYNCTSLTSANMPLVTSIGESTFYGCTSLTSANMPLVTSIGESAFYGCTSLTSANMPLVTSIGESAFYNCTSITSADIPQVTSIGESAFYNCTSLTSANMPLVTSIGESAFYGCTSLTSANMPLVTSIGESAFYNCTSLTSVSMPQVTSIGDFAFYGCSITNISLPASLTSIGQYCFVNMEEVTLNATTPPTLGYSVFWIYVVIKVPEEAVDAYKVAEGWSAYENRIFSVGEITDYDVTVTAEDSESGLQNAIGKDNLDKVVSLKVTGTINGYDIMVIRNKMPELNYMDLTEADIVANDYEYYSGYHTEDNVIGGYMFYDLLKLFSLKFPESAVSMGSHVAAGCENLREVVLPSKLENIGSTAFHNCYNLKNIDFPPTIKTIEDNAFWGCAGLKTISLPAVETIENRAFFYCSGLTEVKIPSTVKSIGDNAFGECVLKKIYTYTVEPTSIDQTTFANYTTATLYIPMQAADNYYWNTEWSQFTNVEEFDEPYTYFYLNKDFTLEERFDGEPDIDVNTGGGIIVPEDTEKGDQEADEIHVKGDGSNWASIVANANLNAKALYVDITIKANRWYFLSFPFKVKRSDISCGNEAKFTFRSYDGSIRAEKGSGGWVKIDDSEEYLQPYKGYIFQASLDCTLSVKIEKSEFGKLPKVDVDTSLDLYASDNEQNASWNFVGNPFTAWYDIDDMGYDCPITRWNSDSKTYEAVRPGDDTAYLHPFEAFFVQRPNDGDGMNFTGDNRLTQIGKDKRQEQKAQKARATGKFDVTRQIVNLTLSNGTATDKTRVVFNPKKQNAYEKDCDAAKFEGSADAELYTVEAQAGRLAINERPEGSVQLGYRAGKAGEYTIAAQRMDCPVLLYDNEMKTAVDLTQGDYRFTTEAGRNDKRFMLVADKQATGIGDIVNKTGVNVKPMDCGINISNLQGKVLHVYSTDGALFATRNADGFLSLSKGVYLVEVDGMKAKVMVR